MPSTERLLLRRWQPADRDPFAAMNADPDVMRYIGDGRAMTRAQSDELVDAIEAHWEQHGFGLWCAALTADPGSYVLTVVSTGGTAISKENPCTRARPSRSPGT